MSNITENDINNVCNDIHDGLNNLESIKGKKFRNVVEIMMNGESIVKLFGSKKVDPITSVIGISAIVDLVKNVCTALELTKEEINEAVEFARKYSERIAALTQRL